jgi:hypothetical protein
MTEVQRVIISKLGFEISEPRSYPQELLDGLGDLRLLGNDAAHIESQEFNTVGKEEVEIGIQFTKEVLKAVFQYSDLLGKLRSLKRTP